MTQSIITMTIHFELQVKCAHTLYVRTRRTTMSFSEVAEVAFSNGPKWGRPFAKFSKILILVSLFATYFGTCSVYTVIIAKNYKQVLDHHFGVDFLELRMCIAILLIPLILLAWVPNLKYLAPVSMVANLFMGLGLGITFYYLVKDLPPIEESTVMVGHYGDFPQFFAIAIFAIEAIGVVMPLENQMKTPQNFVGVCGVLNVGMAGVSLVYILLGFLGFLRYGNFTSDNITLNLPNEEL